MGDSMEYISTIGKSILVYFILIILFRFLGKREVGQLSIFDLVILLIIADIASLGIDNQEFFIPSILCLGVLGLLQKGLSILLLYKAKLRKIVDGSPKIIVNDGVIKIKNMQSELYTMDDLIFQMHIEHIESINEIRLAILETNGQLSIFRKSKFDTVILPIIVSGELNKDNILELNLNTDDIINVFTKNKLYIKNVMYADYNESDVGACANDDTPSCDVHIITIETVNDNVKLGSSKVLTAKVYDSENNDITELYKSSTCIWNFELSQTRMVQENLIEIDEKYNSKDGNKFKCKFKFNGDEQYLGYNIKVSCTIDDMTSNVLLDIVPL